MTHTSMYRMKGLAEVAEFLTQLGPEIAEKLTHWLRDALEPDETMPDVALLLKLVERKSERARDRLREKDQRLSRTLTALEVARRVRDRAAEKLRGVLIHARGLLDGCTRESVDHTTFRGRISQRWHKAWLQAESFLVLLRDRHFRPVALPGLLPYPKAELDAALAESMDEVEQASQAVLHAEHQVKSARFRLKKGQAETARIHRWTLQLVEALASLAEAPELLEKSPVSLREEAARKNRKRRKKKVEAAKALESGPATLSQPDTSLESGPVSAWQPDTSPESGPTTVLQVEDRHSGEKRRRPQVARDVTTETPATGSPDTPRRTEETQAGEAPNAAVIRRNRDAFRLHVASLRGNRRRTGSVRGGDRANRWLVPSPHGGDRGFRGPERPENGVFEPPRSWKAKLFALFGRPPAS